MNEKTLIIVGAGVVGVSTALAATDVYNKVYLIDDPSPFLVPASQGLERIVRESYPENKAYERLASKSLLQIRSGPLSKYFHESKRHVLEPGGKGSQRKTFREIIFEDLTGEYDDQPAGRIDAADALECVRQMAVDRGVEFISERVSSILWDGDVCSGVRTNEGSTYLATFVLLAMGYRVPEFLASQGKPMEDGLCKTAIVPWGEVKLDYQQSEELKRNAITIVSGVGEYLQATEDRILVNNARTVEVTNLEKVVREYPLQEKALYYKETHDLLCWFLPQLKDAPFKLHYCLCVYHQISKLSFLTIQRSHYGKSAFLDSSCSGMPGIVLSLEYGYVHGVEYLSDYRPGGFQPIHIDDRLDKRYRIVHKLGQGTFSTAWLAVDENTSRYVAVKVGTADVDCTEIDILSQRTQW